MRSMIWPILDSFIFFTDLGVANPRLVHKEVAQLEFQLLVEEEERRLQGRLQGPLPNSPQEYCVCV